MSCISIVSKCFGSEATSASAATALACSMASSCSMPSATAFAAVKIGIDCTRPKHAPTTNNRAVVAFAMEAPPMSLKLGATNTMAPSMMYIELCETTIRLKFSVSVRILMLAAFLDTSTMSSSRSSLRELLSLTSLKPSRRSARRSNSRFSQLRASLFPRPPADDSLACNTRAADTDDSHAQHKRCDRQIRDIDRDEGDQNRPLRRKGQHVARLRERCGLLGYGGEISARPIVSNGTSSERRTVSMRRSRSLWMIDSISTVVVIMM